MAGNVIKDNFFIIKNRFISFKIFNYENHERLACRR